MSLSSSILVNLNTLLIDNFFDNINSVRLCLGDISLSLNVTNIRVSSIVIDLKKSSLDFDLFFDIDISTTCSINGNRLLGIVDNHSQIPLYNKKGDCYLFFMENFNYDIYLFDGSFFKRLYIFKEFNSNSFCEKSNPINVILFSNSNSLLLIDCLFNFQICISDNHYMKFSCSLLGISFSGHSSVVMDEVIESNRFDFLEI